jgi:hypothetical protein
MQRSLREESVEVGVDLLWDLFDATTAVAQRGTCSSSLTAAVLVFAFEVARAHAAGSDAGNFYQRLAFLVFGAYRVVCEGAFALEESTGFGRSGSILGVVTIIFALEYFRGPFTLTRLGTLGSFKKDLIKVVNSLFVKIVEAGSWVLEGVCAAVALDIASLTVVYFIGFG